MKRVWLIVFLASAFAASPSKKPTEDYSSWNDKWFVTCQGDGFIVSVKVGNPKKAGSHSFDAYFLLGGGVCPIGADAPVTRSEFLLGKMEKGKITGTIKLCTHSKELVDANHVSAVYTKQFNATYDPKNANITDANYKGEHYRREQEATGAKGGSNAGGGNKTFERDEPKDPDAAFEMHLYRGPAYDQVTHKEESPQATPVPDSPASKAQQKLNDVVGQGTHDWMNEFRKMLGADPI